MRAESRRIGIVRGFDGESGVTVKGRTAGFCDSTYWHVVGVVEFTLVAEVLQRNLRDQKQRANTTLVDGLETKD